MRKNSGFTLIELMVVVEIIAIVAAMAIPSYIRSRIQANEAAAVGDLRAIRDAQITYNAVNLVYAPSFNELVTATPPFLGGEWTQVHNGYNFKMRGAATNFSATAVPVEFGSTGWRAFYVDASGQIRYRENGEADETDSLIGN